MQPGTCALHGMAAKLSAMERSDQSAGARAQGVSEFNAPLVIAAVATWLAVWLGTVGELAQRDPGLAWPARGALLVFLACFFLTGHFGERQLAGWRNLFLAGQLGAIFVLLMLGSSGASPILLILFAASQASCFPLRMSLALLAAANAGLLAIILLRWGVPLKPALTMLTAWMGFQAFAVLTIHYAVQAGRMADELRAVNAGLLATRSLLAETARDQERLRLSRELHDVSGHKLTALKLNLRRVQGAPGDEALTACVQLADELLEDLRAVVRQLRGSDGLELGAALQRLADPLPRPSVEFSVDPAARVPRADQAEALLRVAQEALTNAARHGPARRAWVTLRRDAGRLELQVDDDGRVLRWPPATGNGLRGMRERLEALGGELHLEQAPQGGLRVRASLPAEVSL